MKYLTLNEWVKKEAAVKVPKGPKPLGFLKSALNATDKHPRKAVAAVAAGGLGLGAATLAYKNNQLSTYQSRFEDGQRGSSTLAGGMVTAGVFALPVILYKALQLAEKRKIDKELASTNEV